MLRNMFEGVRLFVVNNIWLESFLFLLIILTMCSGCGHSMLVMNKNVGLLLRVPVGEANYIGFGIGSTESTVAAVRGGTSFESTTSASGGVFSGAGGQNNITCFRSNLQFNEGNLRDAFVSPDIPMEVKLKLAEGVVHGAKAPKFPDAIVTTREATMQVGDKAVGSNAVSVATYRPTGIDNVVNKTPEIIGAVTDPVTETVHNLVNPLEGTVSSLTNVVNSATNVVNEVNGVVDNAKSVAELTLDKTQKTIMLFILGIAFIISLFLFIICLRSVLCKSKHGKKVHIGHTVDTGAPTEPPVEEAKVETPKQEETPKEATLTWFQKCKYVMMQIGLFVYGIIARIPASAKKKALEAIVEAWKKRNAEKKKK